MQQFFFAGNSHTKIRHMETVIWELAVAGKCRPSRNSSPQHPPRHIERHHVTEKK
jgi:hypothetical protein